MTTMTTSGVMLHTTDPQFQLWATEFYSHLEAGLVYVAQTGALAYPVVAARPVTVNTLAGWRMYRFNDPLQSSAPVFIKVWVGTGNSASTYVRMDVEIGVAVDGAGNFVGVTTGVMRLDQGSSATSTGIVTVGYSCSVDGYFGIFFKPGALVSSNRPAGGFLVFRTNDINGDATTVGVNLYRIGQDGTSTGADRNYMRTLRFGSPNLVYNAAQIHGLFPGTGTNSGGLAGEIEAYLLFYLDPLTRPCVWVCGVYLSEFPTGTTFSAAVVGSTSRTYMSFGTDRTGTNAEGTARGCTAAMLWE